MDFEIYNTFGSILNIATELLANTSQLSRNFESQTSGNQVSNYQSYFNKTILSVRQISDEVHSAICRIGHDDPSIANIFNHNICDTSGIFVTSTEAEIIIHIPYMSHKCARQSTWYISFLQKLLNSVNLPVFSKIVVRFLHVYPVGTDAKHTKDNDNYEVKQIIDLIAETLGINDYGANCSLLMETSITDFLLPGSYVVVTEMMDEYVPTSAIIEMIRQNISSEEII